MAAVAEFDPEDTAADPLRIREQAQGLGRIGGQLTGRQDSLTFVLTSLAASFSEVLHPVINARVREQYDALHDLVGAMIYAERVVDAWASDVLTFKRRRAELVEDWESARRNSFWITRVPGYDNVEPEMRATLYDDAAHRVRSELEAEAEIAHATLTVAAQDRGRQLGQGPTVPNLFALIGAGMFGGPGVALLYPSLPVPGPRSGLPRAYWGMSAGQLVLASENDPELAALLVARRPDLNSGDPFEAALARAVQRAEQALPSGAGYGGASAERVAEVAQALAGVPPDELALLAALFPAVVGNLNGMPFEQRVTANRIRVADATHQARASRQQAAAAAEDARNAADGPGRPAYPAAATTAAAQQRLAELDGRIEQYELLLNEPTRDYGNPDGPPWPDYRGRQLVYFDPSGEGSWAELIGAINSDTDDVGVLVPGVGTDAADMWNMSNTATSFVEQAQGAGEQLAMIVWAAGDFPDGIPSALTDGDAWELAEPLVDFSHAVEHEIGDQRPGAAAPVTVIGHSYGGLTVARSLDSGLAADRVVFVESPGTGAEPFDSEFAEVLAGYDAYAMAAPGDLVPMLGPLIHGVAPTEFDSVVQLDTGHYADGTTIWGPDGHSGVFEVGSTAWQNMLAVLIGRPVVVD